MNAFTARKALLGSVATASARSCGTLKSRSRPDHFVRVHTGGRQPGLTSPWNATKARGRLAYGVMGCRRSWSSLDPTVAEILRAIQNPTLLMVSKKWSSKVSS